MRAESVDIYSDQTNAAVLRHPSRKFPGVLIQGDSLYSLCCQADQACLAASSMRGTAAYDELDDLRNRLWGYLRHYKNVLAEHEIPLPFHEEPRA
jgi:hypothetical protein